jgi:aminoglycoside/choline kinase family phosphotransferase
MAGTPEGKEMMNRAVQIAGFLAQNGWDSAAAIPLAADFSPRRYARLEKTDGARAILMDADDGQKTPELIAVAKLLRGCEISAPEIFAADPMHGLVLMEDFGDGNFGKMIDSGAAPAPLYRRAVDVLVHLHKTFVVSDNSFHKDSEVPLPLREGLGEGYKNELPLYNSALFTAQVELFLDAYIPYAKNRPATAEEGESFRAAWKEALKPIEALPQTLLLRDFMPDNLMDLPERENWRSVGVLDFQDAGLGPIAYDLASLCEAVRRDACPVPRHGGNDLLLDEMIVYYHETAQSPVSVTELKTACHILSAQRHMRILGLIVQHAQKTGRREKLEWLPRIRKYLDGLLKDNALTPVKSFMEYLNVS